MSPKTPVHEGQCAESNVDFAEEATCEVWNEPAREKQQGNTSPTSTRVKGQEETSKLGSDEGCTIRYVANTVRGCGGRYPCVARRSVSAWRKRSVGSSRRQAVPKAPNSLAVKLMFNVVHEQKVQIIVFVQEWLTFNYQNSKRKQVYIYNMPAFQSSNIVTKLRLKKHSKNCNAEVVADHYFVRVSRQSFR